MKKYLFLMLSLSALTIASCSKKEDTVDPGTNDTTGNNGTIELLKKYEIKSGIISFREINTLMDDVYTYKVYFDEYGAKEAKYEYNPTTGELETVTMQKADGWHYRVSLKYKSGEKYKENYASGTEASFSYEGWDAETISKYKLKQLSDTVVAGKTCKYYSYNSGTIPALSAGYKGIQMFYKVTQSGSLSFSGGYDATKIEENVAIPSTIWDLPSGITITEAKK